MVDRREGRGKEGGGRDESSLDVDNITWASRYN